MAKGACKCKPAECEECPEWIFTFADLVMLMMGFFVILWVTKPAPNPQSKTGEADTPGQQKWIETVSDIRAAFGRLPDPESKDPIDVQMTKRKIGNVDPPFKGPGAGGDTKEPRESPQGTDTLVTNVRPGTHVAIGGKLQFDLGDARLTAATTRTLDEVAPFIKGHFNLVIVRGHASLDDVPEQPGVPEQLRSQQQMDLSFRRAQAAADYLIAHGVFRSVIRVQACSVFEPVVEKVYTAGGLAPNRRVEVESTDQLVQERKDPASPATVPALPQAEQTIQP